MAKQTADFSFPFSFKVEKEGTFDSRQLVDNFADLLTFTASDYIRVGFPVVVAGISDPTERGLYVCIDKNNLNLADSWQLVGKSNVEIVDTYANLPETGVDGVIYITLDSVVMYLWKADSYVALKTNHSLVTTGNPHNVTKANVGLANVDNTSDLNKPISTATQTALNLKLNKALAQYSIFQGDATGNAVATATYVVSTPAAPTSKLTEAYLNINHSTAPLGQFVEGDDHIARKTIDGWIVLNKDFSAKETRALVDISNIDYFSANILDLTEFVGYDVIVLTGNVGATASTINQIVGNTTNWKFRIEATANETITLTKSAKATIGADEILISGASDITINGENEGKSDYCEIVRVESINKVLRAETY